MALLRRGNADDGPLRACYFPCNAAYLKSQVSRAREDYCAAGSAFESYWNECLCCVDGKLENNYRAKDYLARDFAGQLNICQNEAPQDPARLWEADPCAFRSKTLETPIPTPFPTQTVWRIDVAQDSLGVGVPFTHMFSQLRPDYGAQPTEEPAGTPATTAQPITTIVTVVSRKTITDTSGGGPSVSFVTRTYLTTETPSSTPAPSPGPVPTPSTISREVIIGTVVGAVGLVITAFALCFFFQRRSPKSRRLHLALSKHNKSPQGNEDPSTLELHNESMPTQEIDSKAILCELEDTQVKELAVQETKAGGVETGS
ncbi:hypothetical protein SUNI508_00366 [Seiridium unicorne]|uniref:Uncharacterized protein n=1 Tax=Seiridium unicorne TaxID=138068 RepID=A0ABR2V795_9PEZI